MLSRDGARKRVEPIGRTLRAAATRRVGLKVTALFFAFLLWFMLSAEEPTEELRTVRLSLVTDTLVDLASPIPTVRALVAGPRRELLKLDANPPVVRRVIGADVGDMDTLELRAADVDVGAADVRVRDVQPRLIPLRFAVRATRTVPVSSRLRLLPDTGVTMLAAPTLQPATVFVTGLRHQVEALDSVPTVRADLVVRDTVSQMIPLDTAGLGVAVEPAEVRLYVPAVRAPVPEPITIGPTAAPAEESTTSP